MRTRNPATEHLHYGLYAAVIVAVMVLHADTPIVAASSKLTIVLMALFIFGESLVRTLRALRKRTRSE